MRKCLGYILLAVGVFALAGPIAFASDGPLAGITSLTLATANTLSMALTDTPTLSATDTPVLTGTPTASMTSMPALGVSNPPAPNLGTAASFGVLGGTVTNIGLTNVLGDVGVSPGTAMAGFPPGTLSGTIHAGDAVALQAHNDAATAYGDAAKQACEFNLTGQDLGGMTLVLGVYCFNSSAQLTGQLTLDGQGNPNSVFIFQIGSTLTTASAANVLLINGAQPCNVFWQVGSSATLGTYTNFAGNILALTSITVNTGTTTSAGLYAINGTVALDTNDVQACGFVPDPTNTPTPISTDTATATSTVTVTVTTVPSSSTSTSVATNTPTNTPTSGTLAITNPQAADFTGVTLNGGNQTTTAVLDSFLVGDLSGTGVGWHVMVQAAQFTSPAGHPLALGSLRMSAPSVSGPEILPTIVTGPYIIDLASPFQIASAPVGTGLGEYTFSATTLILAIPAYAYAGTYNSTVTISAITAP